MDCPCHKCDPALPSNILNEQHYEAMRRDSMLRIRPTTYPGEPLPGESGPHRHFKCMQGGGNLSCCSSVRGHYDYYSRADGTEPELPYYLKEAEEEPQDDPPVLYTVDVPGIADIIRIPALVSPQLRKEQIIRWKSASTPMPEPLRWIPSVINFLDDAQDLLITVLLASRWLLKRLPARLIPALGWILTANDLVNLTTAILGASAGGRTMKRGMLRSTLWMFTRRAFRLRGATAFLTRKFPWTSFILQGGQVSGDYTGYGIQLGSVMGFITDTFWAPFRALQGDRVVIRQPPPADPLGKATRVLAQYPQHVNMQDILTPDEHAMCILAGLVAADIVRDATNPQLIESRGVEVGEMAYPLFEPWNECSLWAMRQQNISFSDDPETGTLPYLPVPFAYPQINDVILPLEHQIKDWEQAMKRVFQDNPVRGTLMGYLHNLSWIEWVNWANEEADLPPFPQQVPYRRPRLLAEDEPLQASFEEIEIDAGHAIEYGVFPHTPLSPEQLVAWLTRARSLSLAKGLNHASFEDIKTAAVEVLGGFTRGPFQTLTSAK